MSSVAISASKFLNVAWPIADLAIIMPLCRRSQPRLVDTRELGGHDKSDAKQTEGGDLKGNRTEGGWWERWRG